MNRLEQLDMTIEQFCEIHNACKEGRDWAIANCKTMTECWANLPPSYLIWTATRPNVLSEKELRLFAVFCCREVWHLLIDERSRNAVEVIERFANGQASKEEMHVAYLAAVDAAREASCAAAYAAANAAADADATAYAATNSAYAAASAAANAAAYTATYTAADADAADAAYVATRAATRQKQADWLRSNIIPPNFKKV